ncbi:MAG: BolA family transcriptional regulator [Alphaproteobacteria bacterium]|nr:BolA family transcriptional regulator [Alphaproteobacteria bacterium]MBL6952939.1 BolA family transcriptional regulator [Alphaproteobacteria bacterium]
MSMAERIEQKLHAALAPVRLEVEDQSHLHAGHAGAREGGESHFAVLIVAEIFSDTSRLARQRLVNEALREELAGSIHALSIRAITPAEASDIVK